MFIDVVSELCAKKGISVSSMCDKLSISRSALARWRDGSEPRNSTVKMIADYFGVSTAYLQGIEDA